MHILKKCLLGLALLLTLSGSTVPVSAAANAAADLKAVYETADTIMPKEVPGNIAQTFADLIPLAATVVFFWLFDFAFRSVTAMNFSSWILEVFKPLFQAADGYAGLAIIFGAM